MKTPPQRRKLHTQTELQASRGRLRGALNDSLQSQEVDDIPEDYEEEDLPPPPPPPVVAPRPQRGRPRKFPIAPVSPRVRSMSPPLTPSKKRRIRERELAEANTAAASHNQKIQAETFVMKLFDRSLDLSKYTEQTALYPICRAWMANQPRNLSLRSYREARSPSPSERVDNGPELLSQLRKGDLRDVTTLPQPKKTDVPKIPPQHEPSRYEATQELIESDDPFKDADKEELMSQHLCKWKGIKKDWQKHTKHYQKRNEDNFLILQELFKP